MDRSIRIGPWSFGLDGIIGLVPGIGDAASGVVSSIIVIAGIQAGLPKAAILRMMLNVGIDSVLGSIPFVGDIFDFAYKANTKNIVIFRQALQGERRPVRDWAFIALVLIVLLALLVLPLLALAYIIRYLTVPLQ
jgi:hypothetical protein